MLLEPYGVELRVLYDIFEVSMFQVLISGLHSLLLGLVGHNYNIKFTFKAFPLKNKKEEENSVYML